ncbi:MAG: Hsp20/alpha crystallin family protein [Bacteroidetes bacterium]|jgi:HSP20 family protein|nr:Hsp20/alpha crystallin family protein [Bacteroidota bacterium]MBT3421556.1 Hsp20/alpha crystallin family protein [Bacteroidota bacterium]MBT3800586.1 Hsp20/alpha crystallin family protein [Bacteroidota bacterium]MBT3933274.1 Hsp20/alpha crystallin family protein [Bacteroidota bacterium]MBT4338405.1 Hsp20/alpha crystallin family protein [Bacteroidota bacterium]
MTLVRMNKPSNYYPAYSKFFDNFFENDRDFFTPKAKNNLPAVNVVESKEEFVIEVAAPGLKKNDFNVKLDNDVITIETKTEEKEMKEEMNFTRREFNYSSFSRSFTLPDSIESSKIDAKYEDGVLKVMLPKKEEAKVKALREIKIS